MKLITFHELTDRNCWRLENDEVSLAIEKSTGWIRSMAFKKRGVDLFQIKRQNIPGYLGYLRVYDQRDGRWYNDLKDRCQTRGAKRGNTITLTKRFAGAPFVLRITLALDEFGLRWQVEARKANAKVADRSLRVGFNLPLQAGWNVWAPCRDGDFVFDGMEDFNFNHLQVSYVSGRDVILPMASHFSRDLDVGYSMLLPLDARVPMATFQFENGDKGFNWGYAAKPPQSLQTLECLNSYIGLVENRSMRTQVLVLFHGGDWRPALGKVYRRFQPFFDPDSPAIYDSEGVFLCGGIQVGDDPKSHTDLGLKTLEVHGHFSYYGDYFQEGMDRWLKLNTLEGLYHKWRGTPDEKDAYQLRDWIDAHTLEDIADVLLGPDWRQRGIDPWRELMHTRENVKTQLRRIADAGISPFWYFNYSDGFRPEAERRWPDAICRTPEGAPIPSGWHMCHNLNPDLSTSFGQFCLESAKKILTEYPTLSGFFLDCFRHYEIDFAHDDGLTVVDNRPAYSVNFSYDELTRRIRQIASSWEGEAPAEPSGEGEAPAEPSSPSPVAARGSCAESGRHASRVSPRDGSAGASPSQDVRRTADSPSRPFSMFANKPQSIRSMRHVDGVLLEGDGDIAEEKYFWACIAKPMFFLWTSNQANTDENPRRCVLHGCFPTIARDGRPQEELVAHYARYRPLYEHFRRRVLCFEPDPLRVPRGARGKLYTVPAAASWEGEAPAEPSSPSVVAARGSRAEGGRSAVRRTGRVSPQDGSAGASPSQDVCRTADSPSRAFDYVAGIITPLIDSADEVRYAKTPYALFRVKRAWDIGKVGLMYPGDPAMRDAPFKFNGTMIAVPMPDYKNCAVVKLFVTGDAGKPIGPDRFTGPLDFCGDPESSFQDIGKR